MLFYCLRCRKNTESKNANAAKKKKKKKKERKKRKEKTGKVMVSSSFAVCGSKNLRFIKEQKASGIIGSSVNTLK